ncbi:acyltransferase family protein [Pseudoalteromonas agarivorans]|uniref:acyltransferase family protein n=1 Tax=Pseudoalteromonas agarivorans TaxID=176102 RepID=UPI00041971CD|nr:acyltransferase [Pseudoalteromonas agarivorans]
MNNRLELNTLRGLACIFLVAYHVVGSSPSLGLKLQSGVLRDLNDALIYLRMPLFTFLSGIVYALRPFTNGELNFISKKVRRLILPLLTVGTSFALLQAIVPGSNAGVVDWHLLHIKPVAHFWFIESLFLVFILVLILEKLKLLDSLLSYSLVLVCSIAFYLSPITFNYFSFSGFLYLLPFFLFGMGIARYKMITEVSVSLRVVAAILLVTAVTVVYLKLLPQYGTRSIFGLLFGSISCYILLLLKPKSKLLAWVGAFSYSIYLFHVFFTAGSRIALHKVGFYNLEFVFATSLVMGIIGPILAEKVLIRNKITNFAVLGRGNKKLGSKN